MNIQGSGLQAGAEDIADGVARRGSTELTWGEWWTNVTGAFAEYPQGVLQTAKGYFWNGPKNMVVGLWDMTQLIGTQLGEFAYDPVGRATAFGNAVYDAVADPWETTTHIVDFANGVWNHYKEKAQTLEGQGEAAFDLASLLVPMTAGNASKVGNTAAKSSKISTTIRMGAEVAEEATVGSRLGTQVALNVVEGSQTAPAQFVRQVRLGETIADLMAAGKSATWVSEAEHAIVSLGGPGKIQRVVIRGGRDGISFIEQDGKILVEMNGKLVEVRRVLGHTHPRATGPSQGDLNVLGILGQRRSYIIEIGGEPGGTIFRPK